MAIIVQYQDSKTENQLQLSKILKYFDWYVVSTVLVGSVSSD